MGRYFLISPHFFSVIFEILDNHPHPSLSKAFLKEVLCSHCIDKKTNIFTVDVEKMSLDVKVSRGFITRVMNHFIRKDIFRVKTKDRVYKRYTCMLNPLFFRNPQLRLDDIMMDYKKIPIINKIAEITYSNPKFTSDLIKIIKHKE